MGNSQALLAGRDRWAILACWLMIVTSAMFMVLEIMEAVGAIEVAALEPGMYEGYIIISLLQTGSFLLSVILVAMWIHRSHANLANARIDGLEFSPGWAVGWYFVPVANLFKPFQAMRELWNVSMMQDDAFASDAPDQVKWWWGTWIVGNILGNISMRIALSGGVSMLSTGALIGALSSALLIASAWLLIGLIRNISEAQEGGLQVAEVFS